MNVNYLTKEGH